MDRPRDKDHTNEVGQKEKDKYCIISLICGIQKNGTDELQSRNRVADIENKLTVTEWGR